MPNKVTILVAAYNAQTYLTQCLDSLVRQTLREIQIVCIDDASTDGTWRIMKRYADADPRFVLLRHSENLGQARARNYGLTRADGEFVTMVDSDDWLAPDALAEAYATATSTPETDAALFELVYFYQSSGRCVPYPLRASGRCFTGEEAFRLSMDWSLHGLYLVRREIHQRYPFDDSCRLFSDDNTTRIHYLHCRQVRLSSGKYYYRQHDQSTTRRCSIRHFDRLDAELSMKRQLEAERVSRSLLAQQETHHWRILIESHIYWHHHRKKFTKEENLFIRRKLHEHWRKADINLIDPAMRHKFGYMPLRSHYRLFCLMTGVYGRIQAVVHHLKGLPVK